MPITQQRHLEILENATKGLSGKEKDMAVVKTIIADFEMYCAMNLKIKDKDTGKIVPLEMNWAQREFVRRVIEDLVNGVPVRYIILKARQMGISTIVEGLCYWWTSTHKNIVSTIMAHEKKASVNLYDMFKRFHENVHPSFRPSLKYNTKNDLTFDVEDSVKKHASENGLPVPGLASKIDTLVAKDGKGRSSTNHFFHGSEVAFWEDQADMVSSVLQTIPDAPNTFAFLESTANGVGNYFYNEWMEAEKGEGAFKPFFLAWHDHSEYEKDEKQGKSPYDSYEKELLDLFEKKGLSAETKRRKIAWSRHKRRQFKTDPKKYFQEYPHTPMSAFLASGNYAFDVRVIEDMKSLARLVPFKTFEIISEKKREYSLVKSEEQNLKVWIMPEKGRKYAIGADVAEGIVVSSATGKEGDYSVATVMDIETWEVVARWRGHCDPDEFGRILFGLGTIYNNALIGVEVNNHGLTTVQKLRDMFYRNLYQRETNEENQFQERTSVMGWKTDVKTKPLIVSLLASCIRDEVLKDWDLMFLGEAQTFMRDEKGRYGGKETGHDDCVMSTAITCFLVQWSSHDVQYAKENIKKKEIKIKKNGTRTTDDRTSSVISARKERRSKVRRGNAS